MNEIEKAIKHFEGLQKRYTTQHNGKHCEFVKTALAALRVPVVRGECNYCKEDSCELCFNAGHYVICEGGMNETCEYFQKMNFCPNCGAKTESEGGT